MFKGLAQFTQDAPGRFERLEPVRQGDQPNQIATVSGGMVVVEAVLVPDGKTADMGIIPEGAPQPPLAILETGFGPPGSNDSGNTSGSGQSRPGLVEYITGHKTPRI
jgi:hypothetical protein